MVQGMLKTKLRNHMTSVLQTYKDRNAYSIKYCISVNKHKILCLWVKKGNVEHIIYLTFKVYFRVYPDNKSFFLIPY